MKILIVDDKRAWNQAVKTALELKGHTVETVEHESTAAEIAGRFLPNIIVLDWDFSEGDQTHPLDVKAAIRATPGCALVPIVLASKHHSIPECQEDNQNELNIRESYFSIPRNNTVDVVLAIAAAGTATQASVRTVLDAMGYGGASK